LAKKALSAVTKVFQCSFFKRLKLITGDEFKWQKYQELTRELVKERVIERQEVKGEGELKDKFFLIYPAKRGSRKLILLLVTI